MTETEKAVPIAELSFGSYGSNEHPVVWVKEIYKGGEGKNQTYFYRFDQEVQLMEVVERYLEHDWEVKFVKRD